MSLEWVKEQRTRLVRSGVLRQVLRVELIEEALAEAQIPLPLGDELEELLQKFWQQQKLGPTQRTPWLVQRDLSEADLAAMVSRPQRWRWWCDQQWAHKLEALFLKYKDELDMATASLLRLEEIGLAQELFLRLIEGEADFADLAAEFCKGHSRRQGGQWGPKPLNQLPRRLAELMRITPVGQLRGPEQLGPKDWVVFRVEAFIGSRVDDPAVQRRLLQMEGEAWLNQRIDDWLRPVAVRSQG